MAVTRENLEGAIPSVVDGCDDRKCSVVKTEQRGDDDA